jgi:hypothetical protein
MRVGLGTLEQRTQDANCLCNCVRTFTVRHSLAALPRQVARVIITLSRTLEGGGEGGGEFVRCLEYQNFCKFQQI